MVRLPSLVNSDTSAKGKLQGSIPILVPPPWSGPAQATAVRYHGPGGANNGHFSQFWRLGSRSVKGVPEGEPPPDLQMATCSPILTWGREIISLGAPLRKALIPSWWLHHPQACT